MVIELRGKRRKAKVSEFEGMTSCPSMKSHVSMKESSRDDSDSRESGEEHDQGGEESIARRENYEGVGISARDCPHHTSQNRA